jgi:tRNA-2-methylthio-N6-dimethylallyladenosine synthase
MTSSPRRFFIETWGCQMNELDSQRMSGQLMQLGILPTQDPDDADLILLNSCSVRDKAEHKVLSRLGEFRSLKREGKELVIGLCGCVGQQVGESILDRIPELDFVIGPGRIADLRQALELRQGGKRRAFTGFPAEPSYDFESVSRAESHKGMVTVIEGCDKRCTFCIVPQTRGPERSRRIAEILDEIRYLVDYGFVEIELLGQTVNHWKDPVSGEDFSVLLDRAARIEGVRRLRFITSYPRDFSDAMIARFAEHRNVCSYLHLPVQSGSDAMLRRMGRGYTCGEYRQLVAKIRSARPDVALSTDVIIGFPGETEADFEQTLNLIRSVRFANIFAFLYSPRPGTAALRLTGEVAREEGEERLQRLFATQEPIQRELHAALVGTTLEALVTGWGRQPGMMSARTSCNRVVHFSASHGDSAVGTIQRVQVTEALPHSLLGSIVS